MSIMASAADNEEQDTLDRRSQEDASPVTPDIQSLEEVEDRLSTLSEKMTLCDRVLKDLRELNSVVVKKALQNVSLPVEK